MRSRGVPTGHVKRGDEKGKRRGWSWTVSSTAVKCTCISECRSPLWNLLGLVVQKQRGLTGFGYTAPMVSSNGLQFSLEAVQNHVQVEQGTLPGSRPGKQTTDEECGHALHRGKFDT
jgi:hypothetical protein